MGMHNKIFRAILLSGFALLSGTSIANAEETAPKAEPVNCAAEAYYRQMAEYIITNASKHLLNKKLGKFGGGKKIKVTLHRCETLAYAVGETTQFQTIDASYELAWRKKKFIGGKKYYLLLNSKIEADGTAASFEIIDASHDLNIDLIRAFPLETQYFNTYKK